MPLILRAVCRCIIKRSPCQVNVIKGSFKTALIDFLWCLSAAEKAGNAELMYNKVDKANVWANS